MHFGAGVGCIGLETSIIGSESSCSLAGVELEWVGVEFGLGCGQISFWAGAELGWMWVGVDLDGIGVELHLGWSRGGLDWDRVALGWSRVGLGWRRV